MREIRTVAIVGLGALGALFAMQLHRALPEGSVRVVANAQRIARYRQDGVYCNGERLALAYVDCEQPGPPADLVIFAVKYHQLPKAMRDARHQVGENTLLLSSLNGIASEQDLMEAFGEEKVLYCVAQGMDAVKQGNRLTFTNPGELSVGEAYNATRSERLQAVTRFFDGAHFPYSVPLDMQKQRWGKLMLNTGVNQTVAVYETDYAGVQRKGEARQTMIRAMREVMDVSRAVGVGLGEQDLAFWLEMLEHVGPQGMPSMRQDLLFGRKTEVELFAGTITRLGRLHGVPTPTNDRLLQRIHQMEAALGVSR